jgi:hypothetical protein
MYRKGTFTYFCGGCEFFKVLEPSGMAIFLVWIFSILAIVQGLKLHRSSHRAALSMSSLEAPDLNLAALPTVEEWMCVCDPALQRTTIAMFRAVKEISYKVRTL